jgi:hypothetical protein
MRLNIAWRTAPKPRPVAIKKHPDFFIIGAPKCGTTALAEYLSVHPDIFMARKEMHHFGHDLRFGGQIYRRNRMDYLQEFAAWNGQARAGEASVWYLFSANAAEEIKAFNPRARIIIMLREPTEMLYSLYNQFRLDGNENLPTFAAALAAEDDRLAGRQVTRSTYFPQGLIYRSVAAYTEQVRRYLKLFGRKQVHVILYDDFAADTAGAYKSVLEFLEVDATRPPVSFPVINGSQEVKSSWLRSLMSDPLVRGTAIATRNWLPAPFFKSLQQIESRLMQMNIRAAKRPAMDPALRQQLRREFATEVTQFGKLIGRDLAAWRMAEPSPMESPARSARLPAAHSPKAHHDSRMPKLTTCSNP